MLSHIYNCNCNLLILLVKLRLQHDKIQYMICFINYQIISNGKLKGAEHRAVTNSSVARTSAAFFIYPSDESLIEPAKALTNACDPPLYRAMQFEEFQRNFFCRGGNAELVQQFISSKQSQLAHEAKEDEEEAILDLFGSSQGSS